MALRSTRSTTTTATADTPAWEHGYGHPTYEQTTDPESPLFVPDDLQADYWRIAGDAQGFDRHRYQIDLADAEINGLTWLADRVTPPVSAYGGDPERYTKEWEAARDAMVQRLRRDYRLTGVGAFRHDAALEDARHIVAGRARAADMRVFEDYKRTCGCCGGVSDSVAARVEAGTVLRGQRLCTGCHVTALRLLAATTNEATVRQFLEAAAH